MGANSSSGQRGSKDSESSDALNETDDRSGSRSVQNPSSASSNGQKPSSSNSDATGPHNSSGTSSSRRKKLIERFELSLKGDRAYNRSARLPMCMSLHFLPEEFAPHWLCSPIRILDGVCLLCTAEATAHAVQAALLLVLPLPPKASFDPLVAALYLAFVVGKILCTAHQWLLCSSVLYHCRSSAQQAAVNASSSTSNSTQSTPCISSEGVVLFPLQSTAQRLQRRGALWSLGLMVQVCFVIPSIGLRKLSVFTGSVSLLSIFAHFYGFIEV